MGNSSCPMVMGKDGHNRGEKWHGPNRSRRFHEDVETIHRRTTKIIIIKKVHYPDNHEGMITHLVPDILECKDK